MKFFGEPNLNVIDHQTHRIICRFDDNGEFTTEDEKLIERLKKHFKHEEKKYEEIPKKKVGKLIDAPKKRVGKLIDAPKKRVKK